MILTEIKNNKKSILTEGQVRKLLAEPLKQYLKEYKALNANDNDFVGDFKIYKYKIPPKLRFIEAYEIMKNSGPKLKKILGDEIVIGKEKTDDFDRITVRISGDDKHNVGEIGDYIVRNLDNNALTIVKGNEFEKIFVQTSNPDDILDSLCKTTEKTVSEIIRTNDDTSDGECPIDLSYFPNNMGINLCSVHSIKWKKLPDNELVSIKIVFKPDPLLNIKKSVDSTIDNVMDYYKRAADANFNIDENKKRVVRLTESQLKKIIGNSIRKIIR